MMADYCNQKAMWKHKTGNNEYNEATYADSVNIDVRKVEKITLVRNKSGVQVVSNTTVYTPTAVQVDDLIDDLVVITILSSPNLDGNIEGYKVAL
jgi:hypothetical protein